MRDIVDRIVDIVDGIVVFLFLSQTRRSSPSSTPSCIFVKSPSTSSGVCSILGLTARAALLVTCLTWQK